MINFLKYNIGTIAFKHYIDNGLYCFNYHRIGNPEDTLYDPNVFSCTPETFETHLQFFKDHFIVIGVNEVENLSDADLKNNRYAVVTFDDGYKDNYLEAYPLLKSFNVPAVFFLATDFIDAQIIPWWDLIAYYVNTTEKKTIHLPIWPRSISLLTQKSTSIREILSFVKQNDSTPICEQVVDIANALGISQQPNPSSLFLSWSDAKEMVSNGMAIGSQTCSHRILSHLSVEEQRIELARSKEKIEQELDVTKISFAYPVGNGDSFTPETVKLVSEIYPIAFSFMAGVNHSVTNNKYTIKRFSIDNNCSAKELGYRLLRNKMSQ